MNQFDRKEMFSNQKGSEKKNLKIFTLYYHQR